MFERKKPWYWYPMSACRHNRKRKRKRMSEGGEVERVREKTDYSGPTIDGRANNPIRAQRPWPDTVSGLLNLGESCMIGVRK